MYKLNRYLYAIMAIVMITLINPLKARLTYSISNSFLKIWSMGVLFPMHILV